MHNFVKVQINSNKIFLFVLLNYKFERNSTHIDNWSTNNLTFPKWGKGDRGAVDEDAKKQHTGVKERTSRLCPVPHKENFLTFLIKMKRRWLI